MKASLILIDFLRITEMGEADTLQNNEQPLQAESAVDINKDPADVDPTFRFHSRAPTGQFDKFYNKLNCNSFNHKFYSFQTRFCST